MESEVITRFRAGFEAGVKSVDPSIKVQVDYAGSFGDAAKGKTIAAAQYAAGADVIYQAAGGTGAGVFSEAKDLNEKKMKTKKFGFLVWTVTKKLKVNTLLKMVKNLTLSWLQA